MISDDGLADDLLPESRDAVPLSRSRTPAFATAPAASIVRFDERWRASAAVHPRSVLDRVI
jgi:hypothetical protein